MINIQIDSRKIKPGDTFVAIKGHQTDGHNYVEKAIENGATKVIVQNNKQYSVETINVDNTEKYLTEYLVNNYSNEFKDMKFVGITGTNGKTTTAYMTYELLKKLNIKSAYIGTIGFYYDHTCENTLNTTPDILQLYKYLLKAKNYGCKIIILEASSIGLIRHRLKGINFDIAVYTNLSHDHLDVHKTMQNYFLAKLELFKNLKPNGYSIINIDDRYGKNFEDFQNTLFYGFEKNADIRCIKHDNTYANFTYTYQNKTYEFHSPLFGKYNIYNVMASIGILIKLGISIDDINNNYSNLPAPDGRINVIKYKTNKILIDYAHTPDGIKQVLEASVNLTSGKTYVVFGCPGDRDRAKRPLMTKIVNKFADYFILTNDDPHNEDENRIIKDALKGIVSDKYEVILDRKKAIDKAINMLKENDTLCILGKGHENFIIKGNEKIPHNDTKYVKEVLKNMK